MSKMNKSDIKTFFKNINNLKLNKKDKERMLRLFQVRGKNNVNKVMTFKEFTSCMKEKKGNITFLTLGPEWNRLVFVDVDINL